ncbi:hypothetical protein [Georgenia halophila]|uniref:hypothetical protein n=1 Tax=Georgenia halophila TaxID=620889 RepID=UPI0031E560F4
MLIVLVGACALVLGSVAVLVIEGGPSILLILLGVSVTISLILFSVDLARAIQNGDK